MYSSGTAVGVTTGLSGVYIVAMGTFIICRMATGEGSTLM